MVSGFICNIVTNPFWVIRTRLQVQYLHNQEKPIYRSIMHAFRKIYKHEGFLSLYKGLSVSMVGLSHVAIYFPIYEELKLNI